MVISFDTKEEAFRGHDSWSATYVSDDGEYAERAREAVAEVFDNHDLPVSREKISVFQYHNARDYGRITPYGTGYSTYGFPLRHELLGEPAGYAIGVNMDKFSLTAASIDEMHGTVRHEIAHACEFEEAGYTHEGEHGHREWCNRLDAPL